MRPKTTAEFEPRSPLRTFAVCLGSCLWLAGCLPQDATSKYLRGEYFHVIIKKAGISTIHDVVLDFPEMKRTFRYGAFGFGSLDSDGPNPLPKVPYVTVSWKTA